MIDEIDAEQHDLKFYTCPKCGSDDCGRQECWKCHGEGGFHDCGEDCCVCLDKEEITVDCCECDGEGAYWFCHVCAKAAREGTVLNNLAVEIDPMPF